MVYILGIISYMHDTSASLIRDGKIIAAAEEERFVREKHTEAFPENAINYCLKKAGITIDEIDHVAVSWVPWKGIIHNSTVILAQALRNPYLFKSRFDRGQGYLGQMNSVFRIKSMIIKKFRPRRDINIHFIDHHLAHAASCYMLSKFKNAAILTMDGMGEKATILMAKGYGNRIKKIKEVNYPHSVGHFYSLFTKFLGFKTHSGEGKIMGLAPYGNPEVFRKKFSSLYSVDDRGNFRLNTNIAAYQMCQKNRYTDEMLSMFGKPRIPESKITQRHCDIAASLQWATEHIGVKLANYLHKKTNSDSLCMAGGVMLNSAMNYKILNKTPFRDIFIHPASNDAGTSLGAAVFLYNKLTKKRTDFNSVYLGPDYDDEEIKKALDKAGVDYDKCESPQKDAARSLYDGRIIGWFQGRMEWGPRALGNRSILADPRNREMKDILNSRVKHREGFRPFAPSVLAEYYKEYFRIDIPVPHMLIIADVIDDKKKIIPAVTHIDGTARLNTVTKEENPDYWELINEFRRLSRVPVILNTSFNIRGQPIVENPEQALECFLNTGIDILYIGNYVVRK